VLGRESNPSTVKQVTIVSKDVPRGDIFKTLWLNDESSANIIPVEEEVTKYGDKVPLL
jgi:hypothetical protein